MNEFAAGTAQHVYHYTRTTRRVYSSAANTGTNNKGGMIAGIIVACIAGVVFLSIIIFVIVQCCRQSQPAQQTSDQVQVTYPPPAPNYNYNDQNGYNGGMQPNGVPMSYTGGDGTAPPPPCGPGPAITPLGMDGTANPFAPNGGTYVYGAPIGVPPPQYYGDNGPGMYYSRGAEADVAAATPAPQRANSSLSTKSGSPVTYFKN